MADFQQYYTLNSELIGDEISYKRASILLSQLPLGSRIMRETKPELGWTTAENFLANIEHEFRLWLWANSNKKSSKKPERIMPRNKQTQIIEKEKNRKYGVAVDIDVLRQKFNKK